jgi:hypothetical protein
MTSLDLDDQMRNLTMMTMRSKVMKKIKRILSPEMQSEHQAVHWELTLLREKYSKLSTDEFIFCIGFYLKQLESLVNQRRPFNPKGKPSKEVVDANLSL